MKSKMLRIDVTLLCVCLPLILAAPTDDNLKQQMSGLYRNDAGYWNMVGPEADDTEIEIETRSVDSLGRGNILKRSNDDGLGLSLGDWNMPRTSWRFGPGGERYSGKRGGGGSLDSLGRGHILRNIPESQQEPVLNFFRSWRDEDRRPLTFSTRSLDSLGKGRDGSSPPLRRLEDALQFQHFGPLHKKFDSLSGRTFGGEKRNFDEIDRTGFGSFVKKNFDEIDRNGFGFNKRNFDEIDRTGFGSFVKRST